MADIAVLILAYNERLHIERAVLNARRVAQQVFVIDSFSTDDTASLAKAAGATVLQHAFVNYAKQFSWAIENAPVRTSWVMRLDADEVLEDALIDEIERRLPQLPADVCGVSFDRKHIFLGRWVRHGGRFPLTLLRLWRRGSAQIEDRWMDEHMILTRGTNVTFEGRFADWNLNDLTFFTDKHNKYATREAIDVILERRRLGATSRGQLGSGETSRQAALKRLAKTGLYNRLPFYIAATGYFLFRYTVQLGFLDGREGLVYHVLQGFWYRFLVGAKILEFERQLPADADESALLAALSRLTGFPLGESGKEPRKERSQCVFDRSEERA